VFGRAVNGHGDNKLAGGGFIFLNISLFLRHEKQQVFMFLP